MENQYSEDEFDTLNNAQQQQACVDFLGANPDKQIVDNGQDLIAQLYYDIDFCRWMGWF